MLSFVNFAHYSDNGNYKLEPEKYPALRLAQGYEVILDHEMRHIDTLMKKTGPRLVV